MTSSQSVKTFW